MLCEKVAKLWAVVAVVMMIGLTARLFDVPAVLLSVIPAAMILSLFVALVGPLWIAFRPERTEERSP